jgi:hypothetical protein
VRKIHDVNDEAHRYDAPELIYGLWYRYCATLRSKDA